MSMKSTKVKAIPVRASAGNYAVLCEAGLVGKAKAAITGLGEFSSVHVVSSPKVWNAVGKAVGGRLDIPRAGNVHLFDDAESAKSLKSVEMIARKLVRAGADRKSVIVAVGGGVVGDVCGFAAATYLRGVALVQVPTTLVAQVDSAIGGKTGVNLPEGKNLVGAFYPPQSVLVDPDLLRTLPDREFRGGLAEVIKYGVIADAQLFRFLEENMPALLRRDAKALEHVIRRSIEIKAHVVSKDERESGLREILNFGHTFGHALESVTKYRKYQHGEAVAWGMMCAALLGREVAGTPSKDAARLVSLVRQIGPLPAWPDIKPRVLLDAMRSDKKARAGKLRFVLSAKLGTARTYEGVPEQEVQCVLRCAPQFLVRSSASMEKFDG